MNHLSQFAFRNTFRRGSILLQSHRQVSRLPDLGVDAPLEFLRRADGRRALRAGPRRRRRWRSSAPPGAIRRAAAAARRPGHARGRAVGQGTGRRHEHRVADAAGPDGPHAQADAREDVAVVALGDRVSAGRRRSTSSNGLPVAISGAAVGPGDQVGRARLDPRGRVREREDDRPVGVSRPSRGRLLGEGVRLARGADQDRRMGVLDDLEQADRPPVGRSPAERPDPRAGPASAGTAAGRSYRRGAGPGGRSGRTGREPRVPPGPPRPSRRRAARRSRSPPSRRPGSRRCGRGAGAR